MDLTLGLKAKLIPPLSANLITSRYRWLSLELAEPSLGVPPPIDVNPEGTSDVWVLSSDYIGNRGWCSYDPLNFPFDSKERPDLETVGDAVDEVIYNDPRITVFSARNNASTIARNSVFIEIGDTTTWAPATLSWGTAKVNPRAITTYYLNLSGANSTYSQWVTGDWEFVQRLMPGFSSSENYSTSSVFLTAEDWAGKRGTATFTANFRAPIIFGYSFSNNVDDPNWSYTPYPGGRVVQGSINNTVNTPVGVTNYYYLIAYPVGYTLNSTVARPFGQTGGQQSLGNRFTKSILINNILVNYNIEISNRIQQGRLTITYT